MSVKYVFLVLTALPLRCILAQTTPAGCVKASADVRSVDTACVKSRQGGGYYYDSTSIRLQFDHATTIRRRLSGKNENTHLIITSCIGGRPPRYALPLSSSRGRRSALRRRADGNVAVLSHAEYVPTLTAAAALRVKATLSKAAW